MGVLVGLVTFLVCCSLLVLAGVSLAGNGVTLTVGPVAGAAACITAALTLPPVVIAVCDMLRIS